jgi:hypothetical protein
MDSKIQYALGRACCPGQHFKALISVFFPLEAQISCCAERL